MSSHDNPQRSVPEGTRCSEHRERLAHFTCPRCGSHACVFCWHPAIERCQQCVRSNPTEAAPPIAWETREGGVLQRYLRTLLTAFSPVRSAPAFARDDIASARSFLLLSALPFALLAGIIPHTRTLLFEGNFAISVVGKASTEDIVLDVLRAALVQLAICALQLACLLLPFASLIRAYAHPDRHIAALRVLYYRFWLLPFSVLAFYVAGWALPNANPIEALAQVLLVLFPVLVYIAMGATARLACALGPLMSMVVAMVPVVLLLLVEPLVVMGVERILPSIEKTEAR